MRRSKWASHVGNCVVFNIHENKYRLITRVAYASHKMFMLTVMTHTAYDQFKWKEECGCTQPPLRKNDKEKTRFEKEKRSWSKKEEVA